MSVINETDRYVYDAKILRVVDGDTMDFLVDLGFRTFVKVRARLFGIDTPETFGVKKESEEYARGKAATEFAQTWFTERESVLVKSHDGKPLGQGKYGRWLFVVLPKDGGMTLNEALVKAGHAEKASY